MKEIKNNNGITLIVLIITIIIMLILVAVVIDITIDGKLIDNAKDAVDQTNEKIGKTQSRVDELMGIMNSVGPIKETHKWTKTGDTITCSHCNKTYTIGDTVSYTMKGTTVSSTTVSGEETGIKEAIEDGYYEGSETTFGVNGEQTISRDATTLWVVLGIEDQNKNGVYETLLLTTSKPTDDTYYMYRHYSYNNGITILDRVCKELYGTEARGMKIEDVNQCCGYVPEAMYEYYIDENRYLGTIGNITTKFSELDARYNNYWSHCIECHEEFYTPEYPEGTSDSSILGKYTVNGYEYWVSSDGLTLETDYDKSYEISSIIRNLIFGSDDEYCYWLSSRGTNAWYNYVEFAQGLIDEGCAYSSGWIFDTTGYENDCECSIRPVVTLTEETP